MTEETQQELFNYLSGELGTNALVSNMQDIIEITNRPLEQSHKAREKELESMIDRMHKTADDTHIAHKAEVMELEKYTHHKLDCGLVKPKSFKNYGHCTCGLTKLLKNTIKSK